jgi:hypothetical protein
MQNIKLRLQAQSDQKDRENLTLAFYSLHNSMVLSSFGLTATAATALGKTGATAAWALVNGVSVKVAASTALPAITTASSMTTGQKTAIAYFVDAAGAITASPGAVVASAAALQIPNVPNTNVVCIGYIFIEAATTFTGGSTNLDAASITTSFISLTGGVSASVTL